jgi:phosphoglucomutase
MTNAASTRPRPACLGCSTIGRPFVLGGVQARQQFGCAAFGQRFHALEPARHRPRAHLGRVDGAAGLFQLLARLGQHLANAPEHFDGTPIADISGRDGVKFILTDDSWLLIRPSGTEPVLRIYAEARTDDQVKALLSAGATLAEQQIAVLAIA